MKNNLLYHTIYNIDPWGHGGEKRVAQLSELYKDLNVQRDLVQIDNYKNKLSILSYLNALILIGTIYRLIQFRSLRVFLRFLKSLTTQYPYLKMFFNRDEKLFIWESTKDYFYYLPHLARIHKKKVIALPHNLESLVPGQKSILTGKASPSGFLEEIEALKKCDAVFSISRAETLMLKLFAVNAYYLPYYPTKEIEKYLLSIRKQRENKSANKNKQILLLGSAINPPTRMGMESRIRFFAEKGFNNIDLIVAGYGTAQMLSLKTSTEQIKVLGELSKDQFEEVLLNTDAILIHQPATTGAVIRIVEFLIAGIPVLANEESARNDFGLDGVWIYYNDDQLIEILQKGLNKIPAIPLKPQLHYNQFEKLIKEYNI